MMIGILKKSLLVLCFNLIQAQTITEIAISSKQDVINVYKMMGALAFICGLCFMVVSIFKFKQFKDNPQQTTVGTPIMLFFIGVLLVYMPSLEDASRDTLFNEAGESSFNKINTLS
jgi:hypothetical protein